MTESKGAFGRVVFCFALPEATAESRCSDAPQRLVLSAEVQALMEKESSGNRESATAGASASSTYKDMRDLQIIRSVCASWSPSV